MSRLVPSSYPASADQFERAAKYLNKAIDAIDAARGELSADSCDAMASIQDTIWSRICSMESQSALVDPLTQVDDQEPERFDGMS